MANGATTVGGQNWTITGGSNPQYAFSDGTVSGRMQLLGASYMQLGTTSAHQLLFLTNGTGRWAINSSGHFIVDSGSLTIGLAAGNRPTIVYASTSLNAGTPGVSDPGARLVHEVIKAGKNIVPIPGPSSVTAALSASGFSGDGFVFLGFLPRREGRARALLQEALGLGKTVLFFESPFRIKVALERLASIAPHAPVVIGRELTKIHEEFIRGAAQSLKDEIAKKEPRGEYVVIVSPVTNPPTAEEEGDVSFDSR
jgi:precorrin-6B methylase 1